MRTVGLIAGNGRFPILVAQEARRLGHRVVTAAIFKEADESMEELSDAFLWVKLGELRKLVKFFQKENVREAIRAGKVEKVRLFQENIRPDIDMVKVLMTVRDFKDDSILSGIARYFSHKGIHLMDSTVFIKDALPAAGVLGKKKPTKEVLENIQFGFHLAKAIAGLDLGQTVVVKKKAVLAVEAIEGTDQAILRGGELGRGKITVVKVAKPNQDMRFDVPAVGLRTLDALIAARAEAFAFEAGKTVFFDKDDFVSQANDKGIALVGVNGESWKNH